MYDPNSIKRHTVRSDQPGEVWCADITSLPIRHGAQQDLRSMAAHASLYLVAVMDLPGKSGEHQLRNQEVFYGKRVQTDAGVSA